MLLGTIITEKQTVCCLNSGCKKKNEVHLIKKEKIMKAKELFEWCKNKRLRVAFSLYSPARNGLPSELQKWYIDFANIGWPVVSTWRESGLVSADTVSVSEYMDSWMEYTRLCQEVRTNPESWTETRAEVSENLAKATSKDSKRFWTSVLDALTFMQMDTRVE